VIDVHSHILPEVDDGPNSWETAEAMCRIAAQDGIDHMVATPHANDRYYYDRVYFAELLSILQQRIGEKPRLSLGCDFHLSYENMQSALATPQRYCIGESRYLLVEFSNFNIPQQIDTWLLEMCEMGYLPILTHPERNPILQDSTERVLKWVTQGCAVQITANAITGSWGDRARHAAQNLLKKRAVHFLATDAHDTLHRPPILSAARKVVAKEWGEAFATELVETNPAAVINNQPLQGGG
jgi:protein-tyrosine phosphatase